MALAPGCAAPPKSGRSIAAPLKSNVPQPSRPAEPARPAGFPAVRLIWQQAALASQGDEAPALAAKPGKRGRGRLRNAPSSPIEPAATASESQPRMAPQLPAPTSISPAAVVSPGEERDAQAKLGLPALPDGATDEQKEFHAQATRAVSKIMIEDFSDPAIAQSLRAMLDARAQLAALKDSWRVPLERAIARAETLQELAGVLHVLRTAFANAARNAATGRYDGIDYEACRSALALMRRLAPATGDVEVNIAPLGRTSLVAIKPLCAESSAPEARTETRARSFPKAQGSPAMRNLVRQAYTKAFDGVAVRKVHVPDGWELDPRGRSRSLRAIVGVRRAPGASGPPCAMEEIVLTEDRKGREFGRAECCNVVSSVPIDCKEIE